MFTNLKNKNAKLSPVFVKKLIYEKYFITGFIKLFLQVHLKRKYYINFL